MTSTQAQHAGMLLKAERRARGLTLRDVARLLDGEITIQWLSQLENGTIEFKAGARIFGVGAVYGLAPAEIAEMFGWWNPVRAEHLRKRAEALTAEKTPEVAAEVRRILGAFTDEAATLGFSPDETAHPIQG